MIRETTVLNMCVLALVCLGVLMVYSVSAVSPRLGGSITTMEPVPVGGGVNAAKTASSASDTKTAAAAPDAKAAEAAPGAKTETAVAGDAAAPAKAPQASPIKSRDIGIFPKHVFYLVIGLILFFLLSHMDYHVLGNRRVLKYAVGAAIVLLLLVLVPFIGKYVDGARRWIRFFGFGFQPSEFARFALVLLLAVTLTRNHMRLGRFWSGMMPHFVIAGLFAGLVVLEHDIGIPAMMMATAYVMVYVAGGRKIYLGGIVVAGIGALVAAIVFIPNRVDRIAAWLDPWAYRQGSGWQVIQSLSSFAQGGLWGKGAGAGEQKLGYLPAAHTDFIFAIVGEEFGLVGTILVVLVFVAFTWAAMRVALNAIDLFGTLLATGMCAMISIQAAFIMAVTLSMLPNKGLPLPFVSYGGTALVSFLMMAGVLVNVGAQARVHKGQKRTTVAEAPRRPAMAA